MKYVGKLDRVYFIMVILLALDKYIFFHLAKWRSIFSIKPFQIDLALKGAPNVRPRYFIGKEDTVHPRILARPSTLRTLLRGEVPCHQKKKGSWYSNQEQLQIIRIRHVASVDVLGLAYKRARYHLQTEDENEVHQRSTEKPKKKPTYTSANSILLRASVTITNDKEDKGSPCPKLQELLNSPK